MSGKVGCCTYLFTHFHFRLQKYFLYFYKRWWSVSARNTTFKYRARQHKIAVKQCVPVSKNRRKIKRMSCIQQGRLSLLVYIGAACSLLCISTVWKLTSSYLRRDKQLQGWLAVGERPIRSQAEERRAGVFERKFVCDCASLKHT